MGEGGRRGWVALEDWRSKIDGAAAAFGFTAGSR